MGSFSIGVDTYKLGEFLTPHRYLIISGSARNIDEFSQHPEWGLCLLPPGQIFKVIGVLHDSGHTQITLLDIPEEYCEEFTTPKLSAMEQAFQQQAAEQFVAAKELPPLPEHSTRQWLDRLELPLGIDEENGGFFESWRYLT